MSARKLLQRMPTLYHMHAGDDVSVRGMQGRSGGRGCEAGRSILHVRCYHELQL